MGELQQFINVGGKEVDLYQRIETYLHIRLVKHFNLLHCEQCEMFMCKYYMECYDHIESCGFSHCNRIACKIIGRSLNHWKICNSTICLFCMPLRTYLDDNLLAAYNLNRTNIDEANRRVEIRNKNPFEE